MRKPRPKDVASRVSGEPQSQTLVLHHHAAVTEGRPEGTLGMQHSPDKLEMLQGAPLPQLPKVCIQIPFLLPVKCQNLKLIFLTSE